MCQVYLFEVKKANADSNIPCASCRGFGRYPTDCVVHSLLAGSVRNRQFAMPKV